jgi:O-antigen ligase
MRAMTLGNRHLFEKIVFGIVLGLLIVSPLGTVPGLRTTLLVISGLAGIWLCWQERENWDFPLWPLIGWIAFLLISAAWSWNPSGTLRSVLMEVIFPVGGMLAIAVLTRRGWGRPFWIAILLGPIVIAISGIILIAVGGWRALFDQALRAGWVVAYPGVGVATTIAVMALPFCMAGVLHGERQIRRFAQLSLLSIAVIAFLSQNRAIWPVVACVAGFQLWFQFRRSGGIKIRQKIVSLVILFSLLLAGWVYTLNTRDVGDAAAKETVGAISRDVRWAAWAVWIDKGLENPILGFGYGKRNIPSALEAPVSEKLKKIGYGVAGHGHNFLLNLWLQTGFLGLALFLGAMISIIRYLLMSRTSGEGVAGAAIGIGVMVAFMAKNMTDDFYGHAIAIYLWLLLGVAIGLHQLHGQSKTLESANAPPPS